MHSVPQLIVYSKLLVASEYIGVLRTRGRDEGIDVNHNLQSQREAVAKRFGC